MSFFSFLQRYESSDETETRCANVILFISFAKLRTREKSPRREENSLNVQLVAGRIWRESFSKEKYAWIRGNICFFNNRWNILIHWGFSLELFAWSFVLMKLFYCFSQFLEFCSFSTIFLCSHCKYLIITIDLYVRMDKRKI